MKTYSYTTQLIIIDIAPLQCMRILQTRWHVWFAWRPVEIYIQTRIDRVHDEVTVEGYTVWKWLVNVARYDHSGIYYSYGPVTNVLTQPER